MQITRITRKNEDGSYEAVLALTEAQTQFLVNFAITALIQQGVLSVVEKSAEEFNKEFSAEEVAAVPTPSTETVN